MSFQSGSALKLAAFHSPFLRKRDIPKETSLDFVIVMLSHRFDKQLSSANTISRKLKQPLENTLCWTFISRHRLFIHDRTGRLLSRIVAIWSL